MTIYIAADHAGYGLKEVLVPYLKTQGHEVRDLGAHEYNETDDYPDFAIPLAKEISKNPYARGILVGAIGEAEAIVANKFPRVRAMVYYGRSKTVVDDEADVLLRSRMHTDANVLCLAGRYLTEESMTEAVNIFLATPASKEEKYMRRLAKIDAIKLEED